MDDKDREDKFCNLLTEMQDDLAKNMRMFAESHDIEGINYFPLMMGACTNFLFRLLDKMDDGRNADAIEACRIRIVSEMGELLITVIQGRKREH